MMTEVNCVFYLLWDGLDDLVLGFFLLRYSVLVSAVLDLDLGGKVIPLGVCLLQFVAP